MSSQQYLKSITAIIDQIVLREMPAIDSAARCCATTIAQGGVVHCFGTGHSALLAADVFYRAGGLACVNAILEEPISIHAGSLISSWAERQPGLAKLILDRYDLRAGEPMIVFSVSGVNSVPVEVATESRKLGLTVIAITSRAYCHSIAEGRGLNRTAISEADLVIDNHVPAGDAVLTIQGSEGTSRGNERSGSNLCEREPSRGERAQQEINCAVSPSNSALLTNASFNLSCLHRVQGWAH